MLEEESSHIDKESTDLRSNAVLGIYHGEGDIHEVVVPTNNLHSTPMRPVDARQSSPYSEPQSQAN